MKKIITYAFFLTGIGTMLMQPAYAYLDPSVATYAVQVIAGVVVAVGAVAGVYWHKAKKKVQDKLGIDENRNKEVEDDVVEIKQDDETE